jgi:DNA replication protein DnaC
MTDTTAPIEQVVDLLRQLHLPHMRRQAPDLLTTAKAQRWDPAEAVRALLTEELAGRRASSINIRRTAAGFPTGKRSRTGTRPCHRSRRRRNGR